MVLIGNFLISLQYKWFKLNVSPGQVSVLLKSYLDELCSRPTWYETLTGNIIRGQSAARFYIVGKVLIVDGIMSLILFILVLSVTPQRDEFKLVNDVPKVKQTRYHTSLKVDPNILKTESGGDFHWQISLRICPIAALASQWWGNWLLVPLKTIWFSLICTTYDQAQKFYLLRYIVPSRPSVSSNSQFSSLNKTKSDEWFSYARSISWIR